MAHLPQSRQVTKAIKALEKAAKSSLSALNERAGAIMAHGDYEKAAALAERGREIREFLGEVDLLKTRWSRVSRAVCTRGKKVQKVKRGKSTPLWAYYQPVLQALIEAGGEARRTALEPLVEKRMGSSFLPGDHGKFRDRREKWKIMIARTHKHLISEGWIERRGAHFWRITDAGRRAAKAQTHSKDEDR